MSTFLVILLPVLLFFEFLRGLEIFGKLFAPNDIGLADLFHVFAAPCQIAICLKKESQSIGPDPTILLRTKALV